MRSLHVAAGLIGLSLYAAQVAVAADRSPSAHVHGVSVLNIAVEGKQIAAEFIAPGADIVGFEGKPATAKARAAVKRAAGVLRDGASILGFPAAAECTFAEAEVESGLMPGADHGHGHGHDKKQEDHSEETHAEFQVHYRIACAAPDRLTYVEVRAFREFPGMREVELRAITPKGQGAAALTPDKPRFEF